MRHLTWFGFRSSVWGFGFDAPAGLVSDPSFVLSQVLAWGYGFDALAGLVSTPRVRVQG